MITYQAEKIIKKHVLLAMGISAIPIPKFDINLINRIHAEMVRQLTVAYARSYDEHPTKTYIGVIASHSLMQASGSLLQSLPGIGKIFGGVSRAGVNGATTYALGKVTARFFHEGLEISEIDLDLAKQFFKEEFEIGKKFATNLAKEKKEQKDRMDPKEYAKHEAKEKEILQKLITLKKLFEDGLITEEEYDDKRGEFVDQLDISNFNK